MDLARALGWLTPDLYRTSPRARPKALTAWHTPSYVAALQRVEPAARVEQALPADPDAPAPETLELNGFDGVFLTGSPIHVYDQTPASERTIAFMRAVFAAGTPSFGSCAGLQVAVVAAGGTVRPLRAPREAGFARRVWPTAEGRDHPLLRGRPLAFDAPTLHGDEVDRLPDGALHLAGNRNTAVQAAEIRCGPGIFWGVQYHPELTLVEVAAALRRDADTIVEEGLARSGDDVEAQAALVEALTHEPTRPDLLWRLGLDEQITDDDLRQTELRNFINHLVRPTRDRRR